MQEILTERPNLFEPNDYITFCVRISGKLCARDLVSAVKSAYKANESTISRIILRPDGRAFYEMLPESSCKVEITNGDWQEIARRNEKIPFELKNGELIRSFVIPYGNEFILLIMAHHLAGDGKALVYFIESVMNALSGVKLKFKPLSVLTRESFTERLPFFVRKYTAYCNRKWRAMGEQSFTWEDYYNLHNGYWANNASRIQHKTFSSEETAHIKELAKQIGVSVNSLTVAAFLQAKCQNCVVGIPISVRDNGKKSMANFTSGISISHYYSEKQTFVENARQIHRKIRRAIEKDRLFVLQFMADFSPSIIDGILMTTHDCCQNPLLERLAKVMGYSGKRKRNLGITNLTVLDIPMVYGENSIEEIIFIPPAISYSDNIIGVATIGGKMTVTYHGMEGNNNEQNRVFDRGINNLLLNSKCEGKYEN